MKVISSCYLLWIWQLKTMPNSRKFAKTFTSMQKTSWSFVIARFKFKRLDVIGRVMKYANKYIPLTNRVRGPYCKLRTEFFPHRFMAQTRSVRAINRRGKTRIRNLQYGPRKRG